MSRNGGVSGIDVVAASDVFLSTTSGVGIFGASFFVGVDVQVAASSVSLINSGRGMSLQWRTTDGIGSRMPLAVQYRCDGSFVYSLIRPARRAEAALRDRFCYNSSASILRTSCCTDSLTSSVADCAAARAASPAPGCEEDCLLGKKESVRPDDVNHLCSKSRPRLAFLISKFWWRLLCLGEVRGELGNVGRWMVGMILASIIIAGQPTVGESQAAMTDSPTGGRSAPRLLVRRRYDPATEEEREASSLFARRVSDALTLLDKAKQAQARDDFSEALRYYSLITQNDGDLALADYARVGRAVALYEVGDRAEAILEMEDMSLSLKGYPEVHAALAAALYADKHATVPAEQQFTFATLLDPRYTDPSWVKSVKHWPPSLVASLQKFIALR